MVSKILAVIMELVTVHETPSGKHIYAKHIRRLGGDTYLQHTAEVVHQANQYTDVPLHVTLALMKEEGVFDKNATSDVGAVGHLQLLGKPKKALVKSCKLDKTHCEFYAVYYGLLVLSQYRDDCGSWESALGKYRTGECKIGPKAKKVIDLSRRIDVALNRVDSSVPCDVSSLFCSVCGV